MQVTIVRELEPLLSQIAADLDLPKEEVARLMLESALLQEALRD